MLVGRTEMGWEIGMSFRGFASVVSVILYEAAWLLKSWTLDFRDVLFMKGRLTSVSIQ